MERWQDRDADKNGVPRTRQTLGCRRRRGGRSGDMRNFGSGHPSSWGCAAISVPSRRSAASRRGDPTIAFQEQRLATPYENTKKNRASINGPILPEIGAISGSDLDRPSPNFASLVQCGSVGDRI